MSKKKDVDPYEEEWKSNFTAKLNKVVNENGSSINGIANATGMDTKSLRNYLSGASIPSALALTKLAKFLGVSTDYLVTTRKTDSEYFGNTIIELGNFIKNFDIRMVSCDDEYDNLTLKINDRLMTVIMREMMTCRGFDNYDDIVEKLVQSYGNMRVLNNKLVDYATFQNLIEYEYTYNGLENEGVFRYNNAAGDDCYGVDWITYEEIEKRRKRWAAMTSTQRENWWTDFQKLKKEIAKYKAEHEEEFEDDNACLRYNEEEYDDEDYDEEYDEEYEDGEEYDEDDGLL